MTVITSQTELAFGSSVKTRSVVVKGTVPVDAWSGNEWVLADTLTEGAYQYLTEGLRLRFRPTASSSITIQED